nr:MAG: hypothetical protein E4H34_04405 [Hyphomicrobiales bacterium]
MLAGYRSRQLDPASEPRGLGKNAARLRRAQPERERCTCDWLWQTISRTGFKQHGHRGVFGRPFFHGHGRRAVSALVCLATFVTGTLAPLHRPAATPLCSTAKHNAADVSVTPEIIADLKDALTFIPAGDYGTWIKIAYALAGLGDVGFSLWMEWSKKSSKFNSEKATSAWKAIKPTRTGFPAVFIEAQKFGWVNPKRPYWADMPHLDLTQITCNGQPLIGIAHSDEIALQQATPFNGLSSDKNTPPWKSLADLQHKRFEPTCEARDSTRRVRTAAEYECRRYLRN